VHQIRFQPGLHPDLVRWGGVGVCPQRSPDRPPDQLTEGISTPQRLRLLVVWSTQPPLSPSPISPSRYLLTR